MGKWFIALSLLSTAVSCGVGKIEQVDGGLSPDAGDAGLADAGLDAGLDSGADAGDTGDAGPQKSLSQFAVCDGTTDDLWAVATAFAAAANNAFTLVVDCPAFIHVGQDLARTIFVDNGTHVTFSGNGQFNVDNVEVPAFAIVNSTDVVFSNWQVQYTGGLPISSDAGGYFFDGGYVVANGNDQPAGNWNNFRLTPWLADHRGIVFHSVTAKWAGGTDVAAIFFFDGSTANVTFDNMKLFVPTSAGGDKFIPIAFGFEPDFLSNQSVTSSTPYTAQYFAIPSNLTFNNIDIDGYYFGWQGTLKDSTISTVRTHRYGDLQDADGGNVGGLGYWWAPPHLFYLNYPADTDPALVNSNLQLTDIIDYGNRVGSARGGGDAGCVSGYANSLKIGAFNSTVDGYQTYRPDGMADILISNGLTLKNLSGTYDSSFTSNCWPGIRWPGYPYTGVALENVSLTDLASVSKQPPLGGQEGTALEDSYITATNASFTMNAWGGTSSFVTSFGAGVGHNLILDYHLISTNTVVEAGQLNGMLWQLEAAPSSVAVNAPATLTWESKGAQSCTASGAWSGSKGPDGGTTETLTSPGDAGFVLTCTGVDAGTESVAVQVEATQ